MQASLITPKGISGIACIQLNGNNLRQVIKPYFSANKIKSSGVHFGKLYNSRQEVLDEILLTHQTVNEQDQIEICCHGGVAVTEAILAFLQEVGFSLVGEDDWYNKKGFFAGELEKIAWQIFLEAPTDFVAKSAYKQSQGLLRQDLENVLSAINVEDYSQAEKLLEQIVCSHSFGKALKEGLVILIIGEPNAGKSTLLNYFVGHERVIVDQVPGTTRDLVQEKIAIAGLPFRVMDTAGIRSTNNPIESIGISKATEKISEADIVLWVIDSSNPAPSWRPTKAKHCITALSKVDLVSDYQRQNRQLFPQALAISAQTGEGMKELEDLIVKDFIDFPQHGIVFSKSTYQEICQIRDSFSRGEIAASIEGLNALLQK